MNDLVLTNALFETMDLDFPRADTPAIKEGRILAVGIGDKLNELISNRTDMVDLSGRTVAPGFIDTHLHLLALVESLVTLNLGPESGVSSIGHIQKRIHQESKGVKSVFDSSLKNLIK